MKQVIKVRSVYSFLIPLLFLGSTTFGAWQKGSHFSLGETNGTPILLSPDGQPFSSVGMVWAYGPEEGEHHRELTAERVIEHLQLLKDLGFNTLNLYGEAYIPEMLDWCDKNELAVYFRTSYAGSLPEESREYPDFMDPDIRERSASHFDAFLDEIKDHPSVLAMDMDHRWIFPLDWSGRRRIAEPKLGKVGIACLPAWLHSRYGDIESLNRAWQTSYKSFADVIEDPALVKDGQIQPLGYHPARVDIMRYTLWTAKDFVKELAPKLKEKAPGILVTLTTEHPECIPEINPGRIDTGIDFMSPVHYNSVEDFEREPFSLCKLIYETRWHYDTQGGPVYISETGWRTGVMNQKPPNRQYAWIPSQDEEVAARMYAQQFALLSVLPWVSGYGYFKLYDKWPEGDFGYLRDDGSKKPQALVGDAINRAFQSVRATDHEPEVWIYYPPHAFTTPKAGFPQFKSWVQLWEKPFFDALDRRTDEFWEELRAGDVVAGSNFAASVASDFHRLWRGFAFTQTIPDDGKPVLLFPSVMEFMSEEEREALRKVPTISFGEVGSRDLYMNETTPWDLGVLGIPFSKTEETVQRLDSIAPSVCTGQTVSLPPAPLNRLELSASSRSGNAADFVTVNYSDGSAQRLVLGPTITDATHPVVMTSGGQTNGGHCSFLKIPLEPMRDSVSITLPNSPWITIHSADLIRGGIATNITVALSHEDARIEGRTTWSRLLTEVPESVEVLQRFETGMPAVLARGRHVTFTYDPMTWTGKKGNISAFTDFNAKLIDRCLTYLKEHPEVGAGRRTVRGWKSGGSGRPAPSTKQGRAGPIDRPRGPISPMVNWQLCGPFDADRLFARVINDESSASPTNKINGKAWIPFTSNSGVINLEDPKLMGYQNNAHAFAYTEIVSDGERDATLVLGSDDGIMAWWNGRLVLAHEVFRGVAGEKDVVHVRMKEGKNRLLLKIYDEGGGWGFSAAVAED